MASCFSRLRRPAPAIKHMPISAERFGTSLKTKMPIKTAIGISKYCNDTVFEPGAYFKESIRANCASELFKPKMTRKRNNDGSVKNPNVMLILLSSETWARHRVGTIRASPMTPVTDCKAKASTVLAIFRVTIKKAANKKAAKTGNLLPSHL